MDARGEESCRPEEMAATCPFAGSGRVLSWGRRTHPPQARGPDLHPCLPLSGGRAGVGLCTCLLPANPQGQEGKGLGREGLPSSPQWGGTVAVSASPGSLRASGSPLTPDPPPACHLASQGSPVTPRAPQEALSFPVSQHQWPLETKSRHFPGTSRGLEL